VVDSEASSELVQSLIFDLHNYSNDIILYALQFQHHIDLHRTVVMNGYTLTVAPFLVWAGHECDELLKHCMMDEVNCRAQP